MDSRTNLNAPPLLPEPVEIKVKEYNPETKQTWTEWLGEKVKWVRNHPKEAAVLGVTGAIALTGSAITVGTAVAAACDNASKMSDKLLSKWAGMIAGEDPSLVPKNSASNLYGQGEAGAYGAMSARGQAETGILNNNTIKLILNFTEEKNKGENDNTHNRFFTNTSLTTESNLTSVLDGVTKLLDKRFDAFVETTNTVDGTNPMNMTSDLKAKADATNGFAKTLKSLCELTESLDDHVATNQNFADVKDKTKDILKYVQFKAWEHLLEKFKNARLGKEKVQIPLSVYKKIFDKQIGNDGNALPDSLLELSVKEEFEFNSHNLQTAVNDNNQTYTKISGHEKIKEYLSNVNESSYEDFSTNYTRFLSAKLTDAIDGATNSSDLESKLSGFLNSTLISEMNDFLNGTIMNRTLNETGYFYNTLQYDVYKGLKQTLYKNETISADKEASTAAHKIVDEKLKELMDTGKVVFKPQVCMPITAPVATGLITGINMLAFGGMVYKVSRTKEEPRDVEQGNNDEEENIPLNPVEPEVQPEQAEPVNAPEEPDALPQAEPVAEPEPEPEDQPQGAEARPATPPQQEPEVDPIDAEEAAGLMGLNTSSIKMIKRGEALSQEDQEALDKEMAFNFMPLDGETHGQYRDRIYNDLMKLALVERRVNGDNKTTTTTMMGHIYKLRPYLNLVSDKYAFGDFTVDCALRHIDTFFTAGKLTEQEINVLGGHFTIDLMEQYLSGTGEIEMLKGFWTSTYQYGEELSFRFINYMLGDKKA